jgi:hypothetical protein
MRADAKGLGSVVNRGILKYALAHHHRELRAAKPRITPCNDGLDDNPSGPNCFNVYMGDIGEQLWCAVWGGEWVKKRFPTGSAARLPDVFKRERRIVSEVKYCCVKSQFQIRNSQMELYNYLQASAPAWQGRMTFFRHGVNAIKTYPGSRRMLCRDLAKRTMYSVDVSFDLMRRIHEGKCRELTRLYEENPMKPEAHTYEKCTCLKASAQHRFCDSIEDVLRKLGHSPQDYRIERLWSPSNLKILGYAVDRFPMVRITRKDYRDWAESYARSYWEEHDSGEIDSPVTEEFMQLLAPRRRKQATTKHEELPDWVTSEVA